MSLSAALNTDDKPGRDRLQYTEAQAQAHWNRNQQIGHRKIGGREDLGTRPWFAHAKRKENTQLR